MVSFVSQRSVTYECVKNIIYEKKFDTAIRSTYLRAFEYRVDHNLLSFHDLAVKYHIPDLTSAYTHYNHYLTYLPEIFKCIINPHSEYHYTYMDTALKRRLMKITQQIYTIQFHYNNLHNYLPNKSRLLETVQNYFLDHKPTPTIYRAIDLATWFSTIIDESSAINKPKGQMSDEEYIKYLAGKNYYKNKNWNMQIWIGSDYMVIQVDTMRWITAKPCLLMIHNKLCDYISIMLLGCFSEGNCNPDGTLHHISSFILELCKLALKYKNEFYTIAKALETLCVGETLLQHEEWTNREFLDESVNDLLADTGFNYDGSTLQTLFQTCPTSLRHELACLSKLLGHPYVDMEQGSKSLYDKTHEVYKLNLERIQQCVGYIKENYIRNYCMRYRTWPPCHILQGCPPALEQAYVRGKDPHDSSIVSKYGATEIIHYDYVELLPNDRFHKLDNILPYLKDKTISVLRSKVMALYMDNEVTDEKIPWENTRLLLAYLLSPRIVTDHVKFIDKYENSEDLSDLLDYLVIRVVPKEKELKIAFRGFGCTTFYNRARLLAQEKTAMGFLDKYSDEQAMTLAELPLLKRLSAFRNLSKAYHGYKILYIVIDASSWNNHFRTETVDRPMAQTLDLIFNTSIFGKTHLAYKKTLFYVPNRPITYLWEGQGGGIEGLNQDTWVISYLPQIKTAMEGLGLKYHLLCKGDDLRMAVAVPPSVFNATPLHHLKNEIVSRISSTMTLFGHKIKVMESYGSCRYFAFSKNASLDEIEYPQGFRKIQKCYGANNAITQTLDDYIGSTLSNAHSTCKVQPIVTPSYLTGVFWMCYYVCTNVWYKNLPDDALTALMLTPSVCGGFPIIYLHNMFVRAESDLLSPFFGLYTYAIKYHPVIAGYMSNMMMLPARIPHGIKQLMKDQYSLPNDRPVLPTNLLRQQVLPILRRYTKNEDVVQLFKSAKSPSNEIIMECLMSCTEYNAKVLSCLYACTPEGLQEELTRQFEDGRSINELMIRTVGSRKATSILRRVYRAELKLQRWRSWRIMGKNNRKVFPYAHLITNCPAESAHIIRRFAWGKEVTGITMPPLSHQVHYMTASQGIRNEWANNNHFSYTISDVTKYANMSYQTRHYGYGGFKAFEGHKTSTGTTAPVVYMIEKDPGATKLKNLIDLVTWTNFSSFNPTTGVVEISNAIEVIKTILRMYTDIPLESLAPLATVRRSGTMYHHIRSSSFRESIVSNTLSNLYTQFKGESNTHLRLRESHEHYKINMLHVYTRSVNVAFSELEFTNTISTPYNFWGVTTPCTYCNIPIRENPLIFDTQYLDRIDFHPIALTRVGGLAEEVVRESIGQMRTEPMNPYGHDHSELEPKLMFLGLLQEVHDTTYIQRIALQTRFTNHPVSDEGQDVLNRLLPQGSRQKISLTELKRVPVSDLLDYLIHIVCYYSGKLGVGSTKDYTDIDLMVLPAQLIPWYGIVSVIHRLGKLPRVIAEMSRLLGAPSPTCYYNVVSATRYLGLNAKYLMEFCAPIQDLVILSNYVTDHIVTQLTKIWVNNIYGYVNRYIRRDIKLIADSYKKKHIGPSFMELLRNTAIALIIFSALYNQIEELVDEYQASLLEQQNTLTPALPILDLILDNCADYFHDEDYTTLPYLDRLMISLIDMGLDIDSIDYEMHEDTYQRIYTDLVNKLETRVVNVHLTTLNQCVLGVRSLDLVPIMEDDYIPELDDVIIPPNPEVVPMLRFNSPKVDMAGCDYVVPVGIHEYEYINRYTADCFTPHKGLTGCLGTVTGSESIFLELLTPIFNFNVYHDETYTLGVLAVSDGLGGVTSVYKTYLPRATVVFHTLPECEEVETTVPHLLRYGIQDRVIVKHLNEGHYTLHDNAFFNRVTRYQLLYGYMFSDLEIMDCNVWQYKSIYINLLLFYSRFRVHPGSIIIKIQLDQGDTNCVLIDILRILCKYTHLVYPRASQKLYYAFIVGYGIRDTLEQWKEVIPTWKPSLGSLMVYNQFVRKVLKYNTHLQELYFHGYNVLLYKLQWTRSLFLLGSDFAERSVALLAHEFNVTIDINSEVDGWYTRLKRMILTKDRCSLFTELKFNIDQVKKDLKGKLRGLVKSRYEEIAQVDTATRREIYLNQYFRCEGLFNIFDNYQGLLVPFIISSHSLYNAFKRSYERLDPRDKRGDIPSLLNHRAPWYHHDRPVHYLTNYKRGMKVGMSLAASLNIALHDDLNYAMIVKHHTENTQQ